MEGERTKLPDNALEIVEVSQSEAADFSDVAALQEAADAFCRCHVLLSARFGISYGLARIFV